MKKRVSALLLALAMTLSLAACGEKKEEAVTGAGEGNGYGGAIKVEVTLSADKKTIENINVTEQNETESIGGKAIEMLTKSVLDGQSVAVDAISGATLASEGFLAAVSAAIAEDMGTDISAIRII